MAVLTLIGLKRLADAKQRLSPSLSIDDRRALMLSMLAHVAGTARAATLGPVALATTEPTAPRLARRLGVRLVSDGGLAWNEGLVHALSAFSPRPAAVLYLAGDLPLLTAAELRLFTGDPAAYGVRIARARDGGTNALLVSPPDVLAPNFGVPGSAAVHAQSALERGISPGVVDLPGLALDVDTIDDAWDAGLLARPFSERDRALPA